MQRRHLLARLATTAALGALAGCGFRLRGSYTFRFRSLYLIGAGPVAQELRLALESSGAGVQVLDARLPRDRADVILDLQGEQRQRVVAGRSAGGQVRELQLRITVRFRLITPDGTELIPETELAQQRDISYNESQALAKENEEVVLYRDMQSDLVQQLMRRLAVVRLQPLRP
jgi:LPS-assembly lipoprotein